MCISYIRSMTQITLYRKPNLMLMARKFKILIDGIEINTISDGGELTIDLEDDAKELTVKVMNYSCKPLLLDKVDNENYVIRQNLFSTIVTFGMIIFAALFFISKMAANYEQPIFLYIAIPFFLLSGYYSSFGRNQVLELKKI